MWLIVFITFCALAEIADEVGISRQGVRDAIKRGEEELRNFEEKLGMAARFAELQTLSDQIEAIMASPDASGISPALREALERTAGTRLSTPEYFRKEDMVLMQCRPDRRFEVESYLASVCCEGGDVSGDVAKCFAAGHRFIAALSDGMGTGRIAHKTAAFAVDFLEKICEVGCSHATSLSLLNHILRGREEECSTSVDMFEFDLARGEAEFLKSGAAPSFIKRGTSLFRIRSQTAPIGLLSSVDSERIRVEVIGRATEFYLRLIKTL